jgi:15-cis-phytoene synthase
MTPEQYCLDKAAPAGSNFYYCSLFHHPKQKRILYALFSFQQELIDTVSECQDTGVARIKLQWWREECIRLFSAEARHPVTKELQHLLPDLQLQQGSLLTLINVIEHEVSPAPSESLLALTQLLAEGRGIVWQLAAQACGTSDAEAVEALKRIAGLNNALELFQFSSQQLSRGYCPFPVVEMEKFGLHHEAILDGKNKKAITALHEHFYHHLHQSLQQSISKMKATNSKASLFALIQAHISKSTCELLIKKNEHITTLPPSLTPIRKLWIAWRLK